MRDGTAFHRLEHEDSIRLLRLNRYDPAEGQLSGQLDIVRLSDKPSFRALSYVWGPPSFTKSIALRDGYTHGITESLFAFLTILCATEAITVWADQICIDQNDPVEKGHQVALMSAIYRQAIRVFGWLGDATEDSDLGIEFLSAVGEDSSGGQASNDQEKESRFIKLAKRVGPDQVFDPSSNLMKAAARVVQRPWFQRLWIVEEAVLASDLVFFCGRTQIPGQELFDAAAKLITPPFMPTAVLPEYQPAYRLYLCKTRKPLSFTQLGHMLIGWECSDARDRLNALFSIADRRSIPRSFVPTYTMTAPELFEHFAREYIASTGSLEILHYAGDFRLHLIQPPKYGEIRSWAPDWRMDTRPLSLAPENNGDFDFSATKSKPSWSFENGGKSLRVRARVIDEVSSHELALSEIYAPGTILAALQDIDETFNFWFKMAKESPAKKSERDLRVDMAHVLVMGQRTAAATRMDFAIEPIELVPSFMNWAYTRLDMEKPDFFTDAIWSAIRSSGRVPDPDGARRFGAQATEVCRYRSFFVTKKGYFGLGTPRIRKGNLVCLIHGLKTPFIVGKFASEEYYLQGDCYVKDMMDGNVDESDEDVFLTLI